MKSGLVRAAVVALAGLALAGAASARGHVVGTVGVHVGPPVRHAAPHFRPHVYGPAFYGSLYAPWILPWGYYPPSYGYAYPPAVVTVPSSPPVYIEQGAAPAQSWGTAPAPADPAPAAQAYGTSPGAWWFWCPQSQAYYPYVKECAGPWQRVAPQPPAPPAGDALPSPGAPR
ncbi:MAG: hypothetical protein U1E86_25925 [Burkholderiaceae bacterium]